MLTQIAIIVQAIRLIKVWEYSIGPIPLLFVSIYGMLGSRRSQEIHTEFIQNYGCQFLSIHKLKYIIFQS